MGVQVRVNRHGNLVPSEPVIAVSAGAPRSDQAAAPQHRQVLGEGWLRYAKRFTELKHRKLALVQPFENFSAGRIGHCPKNPILRMAPHAVEIYIAEWLYVKRFKTYSQLFIGL